MKKRVLAGLLCASLVASAAGCGAKTESGSTGAASETTAKTAAGDAKDTTDAGGEKQETETGMDTDQTFDEKITLNWLGYYTSNVTAQDGTWGQKLLEDTFNVEIHPITDVTKENMDVYISSGGILDATCYAGYLKDDYNFRYMYDQGLIRDFPEEWLYEYYPTGMKIYEEAQGKELFEKGEHLVDGKAMFTPFNTNINTTKYSIVYRKDWMEKLGLKEPTTLDELHDMLYAFTYEDPDGNGVNDTYGIDASWDWIGLWFVYGSFGFVNNTKCGNYYLQDDGSVIYTTTQEAYKDALAVIKQWYDEGIIDPSCITDDRSAVRTKWANGTIGVMVDTQTWFYSNRGSSGIIGMAEEVFGENTVDVMGPLTTTYGDGTVYSAKQYPTLGNQRSLCFTASATDEQVIRVLQMLEGITKDHDLFLKLCYGEEGTDYTMSDDGQLQISSQVNVEYQAKKGIGDTFYCYAAPDLYIATITQSKRDKANIEKSNAWPELYWGNNFGAVNNEAFDQYSSEVMKTEKEFYYSVLMGTKDLEKDWAGYVDSMNKAGLEKILAEYEEALK